MLRGNNDQRIANLPVEPVYYFQTDVGMDGSPSGYYYWNGERWILANGVTDSVDLWAQWLRLPALEGKTPKDIYRIVEGRIDGWSNLAQVKADLREWLPRIAAIVVWLILRGKRS